MMCEKLFLTAIALLLAVMTTAAQAELIQNGDMEDWSGGSTAVPDHWVGSVEGRQETAAGKVHSGTSSARTRKPPDDDPSVNIIRFHGQDFDVTAGAELVVEAYIQLTTHSTRTLDVEWKGTDNEPDNANLPDTDSRRFFVAFGQQSGKLRHYDGSSWNDTGYSYDADDVDGDDSGDDKWFHLKLRVVLDGDDISTDGDRDQWYVSVSDPSSGSEALGAESGPFNFWREQPESGANPRARLRFTAQSIDNVYLDDISVTPEPATMGLLALGTLAISAARRRRHR